MTSALRILRTLGSLTGALLSIAAASAQRQKFPEIVFSQSILEGGSTVQVDFADGSLDLPRSEIVQRVQMAAHAVDIYYGRFPVSRARVLILPVSDRHGMLQGTTWGDRAEFPAFLRLSVGQSTSRDELKSDWIMTHEFVHTALPSLPDDQHWLEEGIASYVEPIARVQAGELSVGRIWADMMHGMPNGEPGPNDRGLDRTHTWGRTYWGGALFCLMADVEIRKQTGNRFGLQDALRSIVSDGGAIDKKWPLARALRVGDEGTGTQVLEQMYTAWSMAPVSIDLPQLWMQLGIREGRKGPTLDDTAPLASIRAAITAARGPILPGTKILRNQIGGLHSKVQQRSRSVFSQPAEIGLAGVFARSLRRSFQPCRSINVLRTPCAAQP